MATVDEVLSHALAAPLVSIDWNEDDDAPAPALVVDEPDADNVITH